jgi:hypothetical protein
MLSFWRRRRADVQSTCTETSKRVQATPNNSASVCQRHSIADMCTPLAQFNTFQTSPACRLSPLPSQNHAANHSAPKPSDSPTDYTTVQFPPPNTTDSLQHTDRSHYSFKLNLNTAAAVEMFKLLANFVPVCVKLIHTSQLLVFCA